MESRIEYVQELSGKINWEIRPTQVVTPIISRNKAEEVLRAITTLDAKENASAYQIFPSSKDNGFRVVCTLSKLNPSYQFPALSFSQGKILVEFLNHVHPSQTATFSPWKIMKGTIVFCGSSYEYSSPTILLQQSQAFSSICNHFNPEAVSAGFTPEMITLFQYALITKDHKIASYHYFHNSRFVFFSLFPCAEAFHHRMHTEHNKKVAVAALKDNDKGLIADVLSVIGLFLTRFDAAKLELTCRGGAEAAGYLLPFKK